MKYLSTAVIAWALQAWELMLGVGIIHLNWWHALPTMGFPTALIITFLFFSMLTGGTVLTAAYFQGYLKGK